MTWFLVIVALGANGVPRIVNSSNWDWPGYAFLEDCEHDAPIRMALYPQPPGAIFACLAIDKAQTKTFVRMGDGTWR